MLFTSTLIILLTGLSVVVVSATNSDQIPLGENESHHGKKRYNVTLNFDDIETNSSGIGFDPWVGDPNEALEYNGVYFQSFKVVNVAKALPDLPDPSDLLCASSAPNALFSSRKPGYPWPRLSLHNLGRRRYDPDDTHNRTFDMRTVTLRPTGNVSVEGHDVFVGVQLNLMKLPTSKESSGFPSLFRGSPDIPQGSNVWRAALLLFGGGPMQSFKVDFQRFAKIIPGFGTGVDTFEVVADFYIWDDEKEFWRLQGDWEVCVDDVELEMVKGGQDHDEENAGQQSDEDDDDDKLLFLTVNDDGDGDVVVGDQVLGRQLWEQLQNQKTGGK
ncbi:hypothetical protein H2204_004634 [Knufia peltigerae]|uniref:Lectin n=1 Tax=Knufia peltigerae TaxID=1002370 RepID=A0AA38Y7P1_9EURO|nr:hypothetical protein H2204_004634 [Knufia peltigerae]